MRVSINTESVVIWLSARDTYAWAHRTGRAWPCSTLAMKRLMAVFDKNGLCDLVVNGHHGVDVDGAELSACMADHLVKRLPLDHPCYDIAVGQSAEAS